jgi:hypothetical protein
MSVTFSIENAPRVRYQPYPEETDYWETEPAEGFYEMNLANVNAVAFLKALGEPTDCLFGRWDLDTIDRILRKALFIFNTKDSEKLIAPSRYDGNFIMIGRTAEYVEARLELFIKLLKAAQEHKMDVIYG